MDTAEKNYVKMISDKLIRLLEVHSGNDFLLGSFTAHEFP